MVLDVVVVGLHLDLLVPMHQLLFRYLKEILILFVLDVHFVVLLIVLVVHREFLDVHLGFKEMVYVTSVLMVAKVIWEIGWLLWAELLQLKYLYLDLLVDLEYAIREETFAVVVLVQTLVELFVMYLEHHILVQQHQQHLH